MPSLSRGKRNATVTKLTTNGFMPARGFSKTTPGTAVVIIGLGGTGSCLEGFCRCPPRTPMFRRSSVVLKVSFTIGVTRRVKVPISIYLKLNAGRDTRINSDRLDQCMSCVGRSSRMSMSITTKGRNTTRRRCATRLSCIGGRSAIRLHVTSGRRKFSVRF